MRTVFTVKKDPQTYMINQVQLFFTAQVHVYTERFGFNEVDKSSTNSIRF